MTNQRYYENKITYALQKIDYAKSRMSGKESKLASLYFIIQNYKSLDMKTLMNLTKMSKEEIAKGLRYLRDIGIVYWSDKNLTEDKIINLPEKPDFPTFVKELEEKAQKLKANDEEEQAVFNPDDEWIELRYSPDVIIKCKRAKLKKLLE